jgi:alpha-beta hydrolase superfamily lysophospholipase
VAVLTAFGTQGTETGVLGMNARHSGGGKPVVACHGRADFGSQFFNPTWMRPSVLGLCEANYVVLSPDLSAQSPWGNDASQTKVGDAKIRLQSAAVGAASGKIGLIGISAGALTVLNWARANPTLVAAIALICPVVDLAYEHDQNIAGFAAEIEAAYTNLAGYTAAVATHDPMQNTASHASGPPIRMWRTTDDTVAVTARQDAFAAAVGSNLVTTSLGTGGHTGANIDATQVVSFFQANL